MYWLGNLQDKLWLIEYVWVCKDDPWDKFREKYVFCYQIFYF